MHANLLLVQETRLLLAHVAWWVPTPPRELPPAFLSCSHCHSVVVIRLVLYVLPATDFSLLFFSLFKFGLYSDVLLFYNHPMQISLSLSLAAHFCSLLPPDASSGVLHPVKFMIIILWPFNCFIGTIFFTFSHIILFYGRIHTKVKLSTSTEGPGCPPRNIFYILFRKKTLKYISGADNLMEYFWSNQKRLK